MPARRRSTRRRWSSSVGYGVDDGADRDRQRPILWRLSATAAALAAIGYGRGWGRGYYWGWNDPFWYGGYGGYSYIRSYTYYVSELDLDIRRKVDNAVAVRRQGQGPLADRRAEQDWCRAWSMRCSPASPAHSGETIKITIPPDRQAGQRQLLLSDGNERAVRQRRAGLSLQTQRKGPARIAPAGPRPVGDWTSSPVAPPT